LKNVLHETPRAELHGRLLCTRQFVASEHLAGRRVLDIGCGFGWFVLYALSRGASHVSGLEWQEADLETARRHIQSGRVSLQVGSAIDIPSGDASFDTATAWEVLEHIPEHCEPRMFAEAARVLRPGGAFYLSTPFASFRAKLLDPAWWLVDHRHYPVDALVRYATEAGFSVDACDIRGGWWEIAEILNLYISKWVFRRSPLFQRRLRCLDREWLGKEGFMNIFMRLTKRP